MKPERWQQLNRLFHSALEREPEERAAFFDEACGGDDSLRRQIESLIAAHDEAGNFIERSAMEVAARRVVADQESADKAMASGETLSHYQIISSLGAGGMGHVYLAKDTLLGRHVALKLLPEYFTRDPDRLRRFQQEARAASALNHPNIITIYEIGQVADKHFIATEFIDGATLRQSFFSNEGNTSQRQLQSREVVDIAIQIADALAAAHEAGIVHRDIKPENIMVRRRDRYVKVLDFGLAKLIEGAFDSEGPTRARITTSAGMVMGTVTYMSPEQTRGENVDVRTDIWSLGVMTYEMVAGCAPFERSSASEVIALILEREPPPLARYSRHVPEELQRIISKTLSKDREERYQTAKDLLVDLRRLRQRLDVEAELQRGADPQEGKAAAKSDEQEVSVTGSTAIKETWSASRSTGGVRYLTSGIRRYKSGALVMLIMVLAVSGYLIYRFAGQREMRTVSFQDAKWTRLTTSGRVTRAIISPDGKYVAHVMDDAGQQSLRLRQVATSTDREIIAPAGVDYQSLTFSPDGNYIYYAIESRDLPQPVLYQVSTLGGDPKRVPVKIEGQWTDLVRRAAVTFSPDGKQFAFRRVEARNEVTIMIANADGTGERKLVGCRSPEICGMPAWSADGKTIAYAVGNFDSNDTTIYEVRVADGESKPLTSHRWFRVGRMAWLADGSGLLMLATADQTASSFQIWHLSKHGGEARNLSNDLNNYIDLSLTADSNSLATVQLRQEGHLWIAPAENAALARQITSGADRVEGGQGLSWTPDERIVYCSVTGDGRDLWIVDADGKNQRQLTVDTRINNSPSVTPDGRYVFFLSDRTGVPHIWRMDIDGSNPKQLTNGDGEQNPVCSSDGRWVLYRPVFGESTMWRVPVEGGKPVQLIEETSDGPAAVSSDNKLIAYFTDDNGPLRIAIIPFDGGKPLKTFNVPPTILGVGSLQWTPDGRHLAFAGTQRGVSNVWAQPLDGGTPKQLTNFKSDRIFWFDWSQDGKQLALSRGDRSSDVVMVGNFRY